MKKTKNIFIFKPHSIIDVITNSSSELFVCNTNKSIEFIKAALQEMLDECEKERKKGNPEYYDAVNLEFDEVFGEIQILTEETVKEFIEFFVLSCRFSIPGGRAAGIKDPPSFGSFDRKYKGKKYQYKYPYDKYPYDAFEEHNQQVRAYREAYEEKVKNDWIKDNYDKAAKHLIGMVIIPSKEDSSVPYNLFWKINKMFNARNYHI